MTIRNVYVVIRHRFQVDIPDELIDLADEGDFEAEQSLDDLVYEAFEDENWYFTDMEIL